MTITAEFTIMNGISDGASINSAIELPINSPKIKIDSKNVNKITKQPKKYFMGDPSCDLFE